MADQNDDGRQASYASPPCYMHEIDPAYMGLSGLGDPQQQADVKRWRKAERERLIADRLAVDAATRKRHGDAIAAGLDLAIGDVSGLTVSTYWPFRGEPDLRSWMALVDRRGGRCALPVVVERGHPLVFRAWAHGDPLERGVWNIPVPANGPEILPDVVIAPVVGFDAENYRLGYGGGFFDRTLAAMERRPRVIGVGYARAAIPTIFPQWHDIPMDMIVTESGVVTPTTPAAGG